MHPSAILPGLSKITRPDNDEKPLRGQQLQAFSSGQGLRLAMQHNVESFSEPVERSECESHQQKKLTVVLGKC